MTETDRELEEFLTHYARNRDQALKLRGSLAVVFGCGAVGSHVCAQLAHAGINLTCIDYDSLEVENFSRHYLSDPRLAGQDKALALAKRLQSELPALQEIRGVKADIEQLTDEQIRQLVEGAGLIIGATGHDELDRRLNRIARNLGLPFLAPSLWANGPHGVLGDLQIVLWSRRPWWGACFECVHPERDIEPVATEAQQGLASEVLRVATLTAEIAIALLLRDGPQYAGLGRQVDRGATYFLIPHWPPSLRAVRTRRRLGCRACSPVRWSGRVSLTRAQPDPSRWRDWAVGLSLASAALWHQFVPGFDALATMAFITVIALWWRNRLPNRDEAAAWLGRLFGDS